MRTVIEGRRVLGSAGLAPTMGIIWAATAANQSLQSQNEQCVSEALARFQPGCYVLVPSWNAATEPQPSGGSNGAH
jgi:hypothetical protein